MRRDKSEQSLEDQLRHAREQLHIYSAIAIALDRPHELCDAISVSADPEAARQAIRDRFGFDELQATAAMDAQFRRLDVQSRAHVREAHESLTILVRELHDKLAEQGRRTDAGR